MTGRGHIQACPYRPYGAYGPYGTAFCYILCSSPKRRSRDNK